MHLDAQTIPAGTTLDTDLCIVGAGAAGITLAREFAGSTVRVCLLESGGYEGDPDTQLLYEGAIAGLPYYPLQACRLRFFGGTTNHWGGWCMPAQAHDFEERPWIPHTGWPFAKSHLDPFLERAHKLCELGPYNYDPAFWADPKKTPQLPFEKKRLATVITQFSPPTRFGQRYRDDVARPDNVTVCLNANALEIDAAETAVSRILCATTKGNRFHVRAKHYVIAAGGIETARLLLLSNRRHVRGLGNAHDLVGRYFADSFVSKAGEVRPSDPKLALGLYRQHRSKDHLIKGYLQPSPELQKELALTAVTYTLAPVFDATYEKAARSEGSNSLFYILESVKQRKLPDEFGRHVGNVISDIDQVAISTYRKLRHAEMPIEYYELYIGQDCAPNPDSRVTLGEELDAFGQRKVRLDWRLTDLDRRSFDRAQKLFAQEFGALGLGRVKLESYDAQQWPQLEHGAVAAGWHHLGTTRMHADPRRGVVDANCRIHGMANLHVASSSVFPSFEGQPTLTIVALAIRLADHLRQTFAKA